MKIFLCITALFYLLGCVIVQAVPATNPTASNCISTAALNELRRQVKNAGKCKANVCFAIDGSGAIESAQFQNQKNFVFDAVRALGTENEVRLAACQFASSVTPIQPLTTDVSKFNEAVYRVRQVKSSSFAIGGIDYCISQLLSRVGEANKIVVLSDGRSSFNSTALARLDLFRKAGGSVCAVGAGFVDSAALLRIAGGDKDLVYYANSFLDVLTLQNVMKKLVSQICGVQEQMFQHY